MTPLSALGLVALGILGAVLAISLFGTWAFAAVLAGFAIAYALCLHASRPPIATLLLFGFCFGLELYGSARFGLALLAGAVTLSAAAFTPQVFRFTTPALQGILGLLLCLLLIASLLSRPSVILAAPLSLIAAWAVGTLTLYWRSRSRREGGYEHA